MDLGIVTKITGSLTSIFYLTGSFKNTIQDIWVKRLYYIGSGFSIGIILLLLFIIEKYYQNLKLLKRIKFLSNGSN